MTILATDTCQAAWHDSWRRMRIQRAFAAQLGDEAAGRVAQLRREQVVDWTSWGGWRGFAAMPLEGADVCPAAGRATRYREGGDGERRPRRPSLGALMLAASGAGQRGTNVAGDRASRAALLLGWSLLRLAMGLATGRRWNQR